MAVMENFAFKPPLANTTFNGPNFYNVFKDSEFLKIDANVEQILMQGYELRKKLNTVEPGNFINIDGMNHGPNNPLLVKRTTKDIRVENYEFTYNRLVALAAGYAYENRKKFPKMQTSEAKVLGLEWDQNNDDKCKLYLSASSGTEYLTDQFSFWPLLCGMRKYQLKKIPVELVVKMGNIKNADGVSMAQVLKNNLVKAKRIWLMFPNASLRDLQTLIDNDETPEFKKLFHG